MRAAKYVLWSQLNDTYRYFLWKPLVILLLIYSTMNMSAIIMKFRPIKTQK